MATDATDWAALKPLRFATWETEEASALGQTTVELIVEVTGKVMVVARSEEMMCKLVGPAAVEAMCVEFGTGYGGAFGCWLRLIGEALACT